MSDKLKRLFEETLLRNLDILTAEARLSWEGDGINPVAVVRVSDVKDMLKACAANLAQVLAATEEV